MLFLLHLSCFYMRCDAHTIIGMCSLILFFVFLSLSRFFDVKFVVIAGKCMWCLSVCVYVLFHFSILSVSMLPSVVFFSIQLLSHLHHFLWPFFSVLFGLMILFRVYTVLGLNKWNVSLNKTKQKLSVSVLSLPFQCSFLFRWNWWNLRKMK